MKLKGENVLLELAAKYESQLAELFANIAFDVKFKYLSGSSYRDKYKASESTWNRHEFVSIHNGTVLGYMKYNIDRDSNTAHAMQIANFYDVNLIFSKDLKVFLEDIFEKFKFRKLSYCVYIGNPIEQAYDRMTEKYGGKIVGVKSKEDKLIDGEYYDCKLYEILREDYLKTK